MTTRIDRRFAALHKAARPALVTFVTAGDPDYDTSLAILKALPAAGADIVELGMPFSDPMADGPAIQAAGLRALKGGQTHGEDARHGARLPRSATRTRRSCSWAITTRSTSTATTASSPMRSEAGVDGLIVVDLPPEEDDELCLPAMKAGLNFIRLATPTTDDERLPAVLANTSGFVYYVSITGHHRDARRRIRPASPRRLTGSSGIPIYR